MLDSGRWPQAACRRNWQASSCCPFTFAAGFLQEQGRETPAPRQAILSDTLILSDSGRNRVYRATSGAMVLIALFNAFHGVSGNGMMDAGQLMLRVALPALMLIVISNLLFYFLVSRARLWVQELHLSLTLNLLMAWLILTQAPHGATTVWRFLPVPVRVRDFNIPPHLLVTLVHSANQLYLTQGAQRADDRQRGDQLHGVFSSCSPSAWPSWSTKSTPQAP